MWGLLRGSRASKRKTAQVRDVGDCKGGMKTGRGPSLPGGLLQWGQKTFGGTHSSVLITFWAKTCTRILTHQTDIFTCGFQPPRGKEAVGCWAFNCRGSWGSQAAMPKPGSCWVPKENFVGQPALMGAEAGTPRRGCRAGWRGAGQPQCLPHCGTWGAGGAFCGWVAARSRPRTACEPPAAPSVGATATTRAISRAEPRTVLVGPMPNPAAALTR